MQEESCIIGMTCVAVPGPTPSVGPTGVPVIAYGGDRERGREGEDRGDEPAEGGVFAWGDFVQQLSTPHFFI